MLSVPRRANDAMYVNMLHGYDVSSMFFVQIDLGNLGSLLNLPAMRDCEEIWACSVRLCSLITLSSF